MELFKKIILFTTFFINNFIAMSQSKDNISNNIITNGYQFQTNSELIESKIIFDQLIEGTAGTTWIFEISNCELVILTFNWDVRPNAIPKINNKYKITKDGLENIEVDIKYKFHITNNTKIKQNWTQLIGYIDQNIMINIKQNYPYFTNIKDVDFNRLLIKYNLKTDSLK